MLTFAMLFGLYAPVSVLAEEEAEETTLSAEEELEQLLEIEDIGEAGEYTDMRAMTTSPSNWNPHTWENSIDTNILDNITTSLFSYDYDYDSGSMTMGYSIIPRMLAELPIDVTEEYAGQYNVPEDATEGYAHKFILRDTLQWEDGTPIDADTFVYSVKELINPAMANHRADMLWSGAQVVYGAERYFKQGQNAPMSLDKYAEMQGYETVDEFVADNADMPASVNWSRSFNDMYVDGEWGGEDFENKIVDSGLTIADIKDLFIEKALEWGETEEQGIEYYEAETFIMYDYPEMDFSEVGFQKTGDLEFVVIKDKPLIGFDFYWNCRSYDLVYEPFYEAAKIETEGSELVTSSYQTKLDNTMSYGPYKLVAFQDDKFFELEKNENWFGWDVPELAEKYEATRIYYQIVKQASTRYQMFLKGQLNWYGLQPEEAEEYRGSEFVVYTPGNFTGNLLIQTQKDALAGRESDGINKTILTIPEFRMALSYSIDRADFALAATAASIPGFGLLNSTYIADPETMTPYREYDAAKETLLSVYGMEYGEDTDYATLDDAYNAMTAYDLDAAKEYFDIAYDKAIEQGLMTEDDKVVIAFSFSEDNESSQRTYNYINENWKNAVEGTKLEGKLEVEYDPTAGANFGTNFKNGISDITIAGWSGAAMDPFYLISAYLFDDYRYNLAYNPEGHEIEAEIDGETYSLTPMEWWNAMMGLDPDHPFGKGQTTEENRIYILSLVEADILTDYSAVPLYYQTFAELVSQRIEHQSYDYEYHPLMGYGFAMYNFDDVEWTNYISEQGGFLEYK